MASTSGAFRTRVLPTPDGGIRVPTDFGLSVVSRKLLMWNDEDLIMEIAFGFGIVGLHCAIESHKEFKKYFVIDIDPVITEFKRNFYSQGKVEYHVGEIESLSTFKEEWLGKITKLISTNAFHCLRTSPTQRPAFQNVFNLLAPGGEAILVFAIWHPFWEVNLEILKMQKWSLHHDILYDMRWRWTTEMDEYLKFLMHIGFEVLSCEYSYLETMYKTISELIGNYEEYCRRFLPPVPDAIREDLMKDRFNHLLNYANTMQKKGITLNFTALCLHLRKPSYASGFL